MKHRNLISLQRSNFPRRLLISNYTLALSFKFHNFKPYLSVNSNHVSTRDGTLVYPANLSIIPELMEVLKIASQNSVLHLASKQLLQFSSNIGNSIFQLLIPKIFIIHIIFPSLT